MFKKMIYLAMVFSAMIGSKNSSAAIDFKDDRFKLNHRNPSIYAKTHTRIVIPASPVTEKSNQGTQSEKYKELEEKLKDLMEELKRLGKEIEKKVIKEILPRIKREIEKLKKKLREFHFDDNEPEPVEV